MSVTKTNNGKTVSNLECFQNLIYTEDTDIVFVNETWLSKNINSLEILHSGYTIFKIDRKGRGGEVYSSMAEKQLKRCDKNDFIFCTTDVCIPNTTMKR